MSGRSQRDGKFVFEKDGRMAFLRRMAVFEKDGKCPILSRMKFVKKWWPLTLLKHVVLTIFLVHDQK